MGRDVRRFRDAYGQTAVAVPNSHGSGWKLTLINEGKHPRTRECGSWGSVKSALAESGYSWTEI